MQTKRAPIAALDRDTRTFEVVASDESRDRYGDSVRADGWVLSNFRRNPVLLWSHKATEPPVGRVTDIYVKGARMLATCRLLPAGSSPLVDQIWRGLSEGVIRAVSVGFRPLVAPTPIVERNGEQSGYLYTRQELLELSLVSVPANPSALLTDKAAPNHVANFLDARRAELDRLRAGA